MLDEHAELAMFNANKHKLQRDKHGHLGGPENYNLGAIREDDTDPGDFALIADYADRANVTKVRIREGYVVCRHNPWGHWRVVGRKPDNGQPIPQELCSTFTGLDEAVRAILRHKGKME